MYGAQPSLAGLDRWERMPHTSTSARTTRRSSTAGSAVARPRCWAALREPRAVRPRPGHQPRRLDGARPGDRDAAVDASCRSARCGWSTPATAPAACSTGRSDPGESIRVPIAGVGGDPAAGVTAVVANVTAVGATQPNFFTVYPGGTADPGTSNLNAGPGRPVPNLVVMGVGTDGTIEVYNSHGNAHCLVDVFGYFTDGAGDRFTPITPRAAVRHPHRRRRRAGRQGARRRRHRRAGPRARRRAASSASRRSCSTSPSPSPTRGGWLRATPAGQAGGSADVERQLRPRPDHAQPGDLQARRRRPDHGRRARHRAT